MDNIPTAEEFCKEFKPTGKTWQDNFHQTIIEFAKLHVQKALEEASEKVITNWPEIYTVKIDKNSILNSYPLDLIR